MKIFGKKKAPTVSEPVADDQGKAKANHPESSSSAENVPSYFSSNFFHSKPSSLSSPSSSKDNAPNIEELMSKDPATLTSKERRILRRFQQRQNGSSDDKEPSTLEYATTTAEPPKQYSVEDLAHGLVDSSSLPNNLEQPTLDIKILVQQLQGFNSKERRQLLRSWKQQQSQSSASASIDADSVDKAIQWMKEEAKRMGFENREEKMQNETKGDNDLEIQVDVVVVEEDSGHVNKKKRKMILEESMDPNQFHDTTDSKKMRQMETTRTHQEEQDTTTNGKGAVKKDWSHLTPVERQRREVQRQMQKEAEERRRKALLENGPGTLSPLLAGKHKHPLNSERRRANKRKPSGKIAKMLFKKRERT